MTRARANIATCILGALAMTFAESCRCSRAIAELIEGTGDVSARGEGQGEWASAAPGHEFAIGDAVRTGRASAARIRIGARGGVFMQPETLLRFSSERPDSIGVRVDSGDVEIEDATIETELGLVRVRAGSRVRVRAVDASPPHFEVIAGEVEYDGQGRRGTLAAGRSLDFIAGDVVLETEDRAASPPREVASPAVAAAEVGAEELPSDEVEEPLPEPAIPSEAPQENVPPGLARGHLSIAAGESPTIHDPGEPPTAVTLDFSGQCSGAAIVTTTSGRGRAARFRGETRVTVPLRVGRNRYSIACLAGGQAPRGGIVTVRPDDGSTRLDAVPPRNVVDLDGRSYDVLYQNALPILTVRTRDAVTQGATLEISTNGRVVRTVPAPQGRVELGSGELGEGTHSLVLVEGQRRSPATNVRVRFDNAAPAASLREPAGSQVSGASVHVAGVVLAGFGVRAGGVELPIDEQLRFSGEVPVPSDTDALAIRFAHPRRGVHYYLRRVAGR